MNRRLVLLLIALASATVLPGHFSAIAQTPTRLQVEPIDPMSHPPQVIRVPSPAGVDSLWYWEDDPSNGSYQVTMTYPRQEVLPGLNPFSTGSISVKEILRDTISGRIRFRLDIETPLTVSFDLPLVDGAFQTFYVARPPFRDRLGICPHTRVERQTVFADTLANDSPRELVDLTSTDPPALSGEPLVGEASAWRFSYEPTSTGSHKLQAIFQGASGRYVGREVGWSREVELCWRLTVVEGNPRTAELVADSAIEIVYPGQVIRPVRVQNSDGLLDRFPHGATTSFPIRTVEAEPREVGYLRRIDSLDFILSIHPDAGPAPVLQIYSAGGEPLYLLTTEIRGKPTLNRLHLVRSRLTSEEAELWPGDSATLVIRGRHLYADLPFKTGERLAARLISTNDDDLLEVELFLSADAPLGSSVRLALGPDALLPIDFSIVENPLAEPVHVSVGGRSTNGSCPSKEDTYRPASLEAEYHDPFDLCLRFQAIGPDDHGPQYLLLRYELDAPSFQKAVVRQDSIALRSATGRIGRRATHFRPGPTVPPGEAFGDSLRMALQEGAEIRVSVRHSRDLHEGALPRERTYRLFNADPFAWSLRLNAASGGYLFQYVDEEGSDERGWTNDIAAGASLRTELRFFKRAIERRFRILLGGGSFSADASEFLEKPALFGGVAIRPPGLGDTWLEITGGWGEDGPFMLFSPSWNLGFTLKETRVSKTMDP